MDDSAGQALIRALVVLARMRASSRASIAVQRQERLALARGDRAFRAFMANACGARPRRRGSVGKAAPQ